MKRITVGNRRLENVSARIGQMRARLKSGLPSFQHRVLTVAIQGNSLRLALVIMGQGVVNWGYVPFNPALLRNGFIANIQGISHVIQNTLASKGIPRVPATAAFTGFRSLCRVINLPRAKDVVPRDVIPGEARHLMSYSEKEHCLFWQKAVVPGQFIVVVVPRAPLQTFVETMKLAGLSLHRVELTPLALAKAAGQPQSVVANIEKDSIDIIITIDYMPVVVRSLWFGEEPLDVDSAPQRLAEELVKTISYYNGADPEIPLSPPLPIHLAGGFPVEELSPVVSQRTGHPVLAISPAFSVPEGFSVSAMAVNLGLAMSSS